MRACEFVRLCVCFFECFGQCSSASYRCCVVCSRFCFCFQLCFVDLALVVVDNPRYFVRVRQRCPSKNEAKTNAKVLAPTAGR